MSKLNKPQATARPAREPFLYVTRRDQIPLGRAILIRVIAILLALIVCSVVTRVLTGDDPLSIYATILHGAFGTGRMLVTLHDIAILLCISLAVTPAFRMRFWNTGAEARCSSAAFPPRYACWCWAARCRWSAHPHHGSFRHPLRRYLGHYPRLHLRPTGTPMRPSSPL